MSWAPNDLVTDVDLKGYESTILTQFAVPDWQERRQKAIEDWLFPLLESAGFTPPRLRTRHTPVSAFGYTSASFTDKTSAAGTDNGLVLSTILAASTDYLYLGFKEPFRGLSVRMLDNVNAAANVLGVQLWADGWVTPAGVINETKVGSACFGKGGAITWRMPDAVVTRSVSTSGALYWARLLLSAAPTSGTAIGPVSVIRRSRLCAAVTLRTLSLIFREAPSQQDGPWEAKADWYEKEAERAWLRVAGQIGPEFDTDGDDTIGDTERGQTAEDVNGGGWTMERM